MNGSSKFPSRRQEHFGQPVGESLKMPAPGLRLFRLIYPQPFNFRLRLRTGTMLAAAVLLLAIRDARAQATAAEVPRVRRVLMIFSEAHDLPGNVILEQAAREEIQTHSRTPTEFFSESMDASRFPVSRYYELFKEYIQNKYAGQNLSAVMLFLGRDFELTKELPSVLGTNLPAIFVVINDHDSPGPPANRRFTGIFQRFDVPGTVQFIFHLQPETRRVVIIGGESPTDRATLQRISESAQLAEGVRFDFWTNRPIARIRNEVKLLTEGSVILLGSVQRDVTGEPFYTPQVAQMLARSATVPVYVFSEGSVGTGVVGGNVVNLDDLGTAAGRVALRVLAGRPVEKIPVQVRSNGVPMVDWRVLDRWNINPRRLPADCIMRYRPATLWESYRRLILLVATILVAQAMTITALLVQLKLRRRAEAEILRQRTELTHVGRVSMLGQLASALTHELNQPLGAILRNAEAAQIHLHGAAPNLHEIRAILTDICRDDKRAGDVIDRMRSLFKRQKPSPATLDLRALVEDTVAMARPDAEARQVRLKVDMPPELPTAQGDRVHVQQVLLNLIFNGLDAAQGGSRSRRLITVRVGETRNGNLKVSVADTGAGVSPDDAANIFEPFFTTKANGMGMGLAISRSIIEAHGGDIWMTSNAMEGTTFTFILPPAGLDRVKPGDAPALGK